MRTKKPLPLLTLMTVFPLLGLSIAQASQLDVALSKETVSVEVSVDTNSSRAPGSQVTLGGIYNENDDVAGFIGITSQGADRFNTAGENTASWSLGVGARLYYASLDRAGDPDIGALALGVNGQIRPAANIPLTLTGEFFYAPEITTFDDGDDLLDTRIRAQTEISSYARAFIGYRQLTVGLKSGGERDIDDHIQLGINFDF